MGICNTIVIHLSYIMKDKKNEYKPRSIRVSDKTWEEFIKYKKRGRSWDLFLGELIEAINYFKNL